MNEVRINGALSRVAKLRINRVPLSFSRQNMEYRVTTLVKFTFNA